jgi:hypothetical protein
MKRALLLAVSCAAFTLTAFGAVLPTPVVAQSSPAAPDDGRGTDFVVARADNICGLDNPRQLTRPAKVAYDKLLKATPEMKLLKRERIKPDSPRGINLRTEAENRIRKACEKVRSAKSYCSVWKKITRRDGKKLTDITKQVLLEI